MQKEGSKLPKAQQKVRGTPVSWLKRGKEAHPVRLVGLPSYIQLFARMSLFSAYLYTNYARPSLQCGTGGEKH